MKRILLATDLCANSDRAMERAVKIAKDSGAKLHVLHVFSSEPNESEYAHNSVIEIEAFIKECLGDSKESHGLEVVIDIVKSNKAHVKISNYAAQIGAKLIVMGMHRKARFLDMFKATTFSKVLLQCPIPILMVMDKPGDSYSKVLCGNDFANTFYKSFHAAVDLAPDAVFEVMHSFEKSLLYPSVKHFDDMEGYPVSEEECEAKMVKFIDEEKLRFSELYPDNTMKIEHFFVKSDPFYSLIEETEKRSPDLICVGTHGYETAKIGPVTNSLMADPPCDILVSGSKK